MPQQLNLFLVDSPPPAPPRPPLPDAGERELALDIHHSWIVEAPAGSGKTGLLIQRFLRLLADPSVHSPEQVLAITFTIKATAELRDRVLSQLQSAALNSAPENDFDRTTRPLAEAVLARDRSRDPDLRWSLPDNPRRLNIRTIDSVCAEIAGLLPILSGSGGRRSPIEDPGQLYALAARRTFLQLGGPDTALHEALSLVLLHRDGNLGNCERLLAQMLEVRDQWAGLIPLDRNPVGRELDDAWLDANVLPRLEHTLDQAICAGLGEIADVIPTQLLERLATVAAEMAHLDGYDGAASPIANCAGRSKSPLAISEDLEHWNALAGMIVTGQLKWRKSFSANNIGFQASKSEQAWLKSELLLLIDELQRFPGILDAIDRLRALPSATYPGEQWVVAKALFRILKHALVELQLVFAERGQCDFTEVSLAARTALAGDLSVEPDPESPLEAALGIRLQHLLVDEMQDTSSSQYELIQMLTRGWDGHSQTVFLVGDPKQSIYLFRQARVERFLRTMHSGLLGDLPLGSLRLTANFRSQSSLVGAFNDDFETIFPADSTTLHPEEVTYGRVFATRLASISNSPGAPSFADSGKGWGHGGNTAGLILGLDLAASASTLATSATNASRVWHPNPLPFVPRQPGNTQAARNTRRQRRADAQEIRSLVESWRTHPLPANRSTPWKIAVLCRSRNHLVEIVAALKESPAIPFRAVDVDPLKDRPEVQDLVALTRALLHPADRIAWLALLRAPWCGLSLADLHILTGEDDPVWSERSVRTLIAERGHLLPEDSCQRLQRIWPVLEAATQSRGRLPLAQLVERTWRSLGGDSWLDLVQLANVSRYLQFLDKLEDEASVPIEVPILERRLDRLYAAPVVHPDAVDLLTIHKAKGLEWDVVIVPGLERPPGFNWPRLLNWIELDSAGDESAPILLAPIAAKGDEADPLYRWINSVRTAREHAEIKRLFYVACTRAREELHLFAAPARTSSGSIDCRPTSLLAAAWPAAEPVFGAIPLPAEQEDEADSFAMAAAADLLEDSPLDTDLEPGADPDMIGLEDPVNASISGLADEWETDDESRLAFPPPEGRTTLLRRLPLAFDLAGRLRNLTPLNPEGESDGHRETTVSAPRFERPEGSLAARALGNAVHAFLEKIAARIAANEAPESLLAALPSWTPRIAAILRSEGLALAVVERLTPRVLLALENTLKDPTGLWLLSPHESAATEYALTAWSEQQRSNIRIDRVFRAGPTPLAPGSTHLWIVDYKSATHGTEDLDGFLAAEKEKYAPQLEAYAAILQQAHSPGEQPPEMRLALYYPMLPKLIWW